MINNFKPLLAYKVGDLSKLYFPLLCSFKIDGIRCIVHEKEVLSRSLKLIPNLHIRTCLSQLTPSVLFDGELLVGSNFQETTSAVMSIDGTPNFTYMIFDVLTEGAQEPFFSRVSKLQELEPTLPPFCKILQQRKILNEQELIEMYHEALQKGYEGLIVRDPNKPYKYGRSTEKEQIIGKLKPFIDQEFEVVGFEPYYENHNESELNELGYKKKSSTKENIEEKELLGSFICKHELGNFNVGSGLTMEQRKDFWQQRESLIGKMIKVKYFNYGIKKLPRHPVFLGFRNPLDNGE